MSVSKTFFGFTLSALLSTSAFAQADATTTKAVEPDNSATNKAVVGNAQPTADSQSNDQADLTLAANVRKALVQDKSLSTYAHNVKVIVKNGVVTVTGPVQSDNERQAVTKIASDVAGAQNVKADGVVAKK